jgi:molybdopterin-containing oxidoreductase family membrane subunit
MKSSGEFFKKRREANDDIDVHPDKPTNTVFNGFDDLTSEHVITPTDEGADHKEKLDSLLGAIGTFDAASEQADDLKRVNGIGPVMEKTLNEIGIFTFVQVSKMTEKEYNLLDSITGSFPGRAQRDDWAGQAKKLIS